METGASLRLTDIVLRQHGPSLSLYIPAGQSVALHSEPHADATDLLDVAAGLRRPQSGRFAVDDAVIGELSGQALRRYASGRGILSARFPLKPSLSAADNVLAGADDLTREQAVDLLAETGVTRVDEAAGTLSGEQQWRILLARALRTRPRLVLAEGPMHVLEPRAATAILDLLSDLQAQAGFTLLLAIARLATASYCQRLVRLCDGIVVEDELIGDDPLVRGRVDRIE